MADDSLRDSVKKPRIPVEKQCNTCGETKSAGDYYAYKYTTNQGKLSVRLDPDCKVCNAEKRKASEARVKENLRSWKRRKENPQLMQAWLARRRAEYKPAVLDKECSKCKKVKPAASFYRKLINKDGLNSQCRACVVAVSMEYVRTVEPHKLGTWKTTSHLKFRYGMALDEYEWLASAQDGKCLGCGKTNILLVVDHCHSSGRIRGLLCKPCNTALGLISESKETALRLAEYIDKRCGTSYV